MVYRFFLLEPPVDGKFGPLSRAAFQEFQKITDCPNVGTLDVQTAQALLHTPRDRVVQLHLSDDIPSRIVAYILQEGYHISLGKERYNIVYVEGMNTDGTLNDDAPDRFNDLRCLIEIVDGCPRFVGKWMGTCEPGRHYTKWKNRIPKGWKRGAARIKFGQYRAWQVGLHDGEREITKH